MPSARANPVILEARALIENALPTASPCAATVVTVIKLPPIFAVPVEASVLIVSTGISVPVNS